MVYPNGDVRTMLRCVYDQTSDIVKSHQNYCNMRRKIASSFVIEIDFGSVVAFLRAPLCFSRSIVEIA